MPHSERPSVPLCKSLPQVRDSPSIMVGMTPQSTRSVWDIGFFSCGVTIGCLPSLTAECSSPCARRRTSGAALPRALQSLRAAEQADQQTRRLRRAVLRAHMGARRGEPRAQCGVVQAVVDAGGELRFGPVGAVHLEAVAGLLNAGGIVVAIPREGHDDCRLAKEQALRKRI